MTKPTYEEWKESIDVEGSPNYSSVADLLNKAHGLDLAEQLDIMLRKHYEDNIEGDDDML